MLDRWSNQRNTGTPIRGRTSLRAAALAALAAAAWSAAPPVAEAQRPATPTMTAENAPLAPGDAIRLMIWREPQLSGEFPVDETGAVLLPILGPVRVTGRSATELKDHLMEAYGEQLRDPDLQIAMLRRVRVLGAVMRPGLYFVDPTMTLADAIAMAGGATPLGKLDGIRIQRESGETVRDLGPGSRVAEEVRSGDQITVPERNWVSRNAGAVVGASISALGIIVAQLLF